MNLSKIIENLNQSANQYFSALEETEKELAAVAKIEQDKANLFIAEETKKIRAEAILKSKFISKGFSAEHFAPFQMEFNPRDYRHLGDPIDYIVFAGSTEVKDGIIDEITEILFLDIKTGQADLNKGQRRIRDAIVSGKVSFATYNPDTNIFRKYERKND